MNPCPAEPGFFLKTRFRSDGGLVVRLRTRDQEVLGSNPAQTVGVF